MPFAIVLIVSAMIVGVVMTTRPEAPGPASIASVAEVANVNAGDPPRESEPVVDPVSLPALFTYTPTGRDLTLGRVLDDQASYTRYTITYRSDDLRITGIMNIPKGTGPFPVLVLNHGYIDPAVYTNGRGLKREQDYFARQGFAVLHPDYRCHADSDCPEADTLVQRLGYVRDVINAVAAIRTSGDPRLDPSRIGMLGHSMGGGITQRLVTALPDLIDAAVLYAPVSLDERDSFTRYTSRRPTEAATVIQRYGSPESRPEFWQALSARNYLDRITVPLMYFQGSADADVPKDWTDASVDALRAANKEVTYIEYAGQPHEFTSQWGDFMRRSTDFFRANLRS